MSSYFYDDQGNLKESLLTTDAKRYAEKFWDERLNESQLRKYYSEVKALERLTKEQDFAKTRALVKMLQAKVHYGMRKGERGAPVIPPSFKDYIVTMVEHVQNEKDMKAFALCFEAVTGFFYGVGAERQKDRRQGAPGRADQQRRRQ